MTSNIPITSAELSVDLGLLKPELLRPDQINWPRNQRKRRKNARRAWAAGDKRAFNRF
jgi:hypothetical protein